MTNDYTVYDYATAAGIPVTNGGRLVLYSQETRTPGVSRVITAPALTLSADSRTAYKNAFDKPVECHSAGAENVDGKGLNVDGTKYIMVEIDGTLSRNKNIKHTWQAAGLPTADNVFSTMSISAWQFYGDHISLLQRGDQPAPESVLEDAYFALSTLVHNNSKGQSVDLDRVAALAYIVKGGHGLKHPGYLDGYAAGRESLVDIAAHTLSETIKQGADGAQSAKILKILECAGARATNDLDDNALDCFIKHAQDANALHSAAVKVVKQMPFCESLRAQWNPDNNGNLAPAQFISKAGAPASAPKTLTYS